MKKTAVRTILVMLSVLSMCLLWANVSPAQNFDLTVDVLVDSSNPTGYNTSSASPGEFQRYPELYLDNLQVPYRVIDVSSSAPPSSLGSVQLIIAGHKGLNLSNLWQQAIISAVQGGTGFVNLDWDPAICSQSHIQAIFGCTSSMAGTAGTSITVPATYLPDGATPHYITGLQLRWPIGMPSSVSGDLVYPFHRDDSGNQGTAISTILLNDKGTLLNQGTVLAKIGSDPLLTITSFGAGHAVFFGTYDYLRADRFGYLMGIDDLFWRSLVWAARKPFSFRGYPRFFASQQDDPVSDISTRVGDEFDPALTGPGTTQTLINGTKLMIGGPWKVTLNIQTAAADFNNGTQDRQNMINFVAGGKLILTPHTNTGGSDGDLYWTGNGNASPLSDSQWLSNYNALLSFQQGAGPTGSFNGTSDFLPFGTHMIPHFWDFSNNIGYDMWQLGVRYITELQQPNVYYSGPCKTPTQRMPGLRPYRVYEQPPTNCNPNETYSFFWADNYTIGSRAGLPAETFFGFATQLQGMSYPSFDAKWPQSVNGISTATALENWEAYMWRFWSSMDPVQIYNHDGGSMANSTTQERQQHITNVSKFVSANGGIPIFMQDLGAYLHARVNSNITGGSATSSTITLNYSGNATDMNGNPVTTESFVFFNNDNGVLVDVAGFTNGTTVSIPNVTPATLVASPDTLAFGAIPGGSNPPTQTISVANNGTGTMNWTAFSNASWLSVSPASGTNSGIITVSVNSQPLAAGTYSGAVTIQATGAVNSPQVIGVTLSVSAPTLSATPTALSFAAFQGQTNPTPTILNIANTGGGTINWTASSNAAWLTLSSTSGTAPTSITVSANVTGLAIGTYTGQITVTAPNATGSPLNIAVTLTVAGVLMQSSGTLDGWLPSPKLGSFQNWSTLNGALQYNGGGATQIYAGDSSWTNYDVAVQVKLSTLSDYPGGIRGRVNPSTGASYALWLYPNEKLVKLYRTSAWSIDSNVLLGAANATLDDLTFHKVELSFNGSVITVLYDGQALITVSDTNLTSGMVALDVSNQVITFGNVLVTGTTSAYSSLTTSASSLSYNGSAGGTSLPSQTVQVGTTNGILSWSASSNANWLSIAPTRTTTTNTLTVSVNSSGLAAGTYNATISLVAPGAANLSVSIPVTLTLVTPPPFLSSSPSRLSFTAMSGQPSPAGQAISITNQGSGTLSWTASAPSWILLSAASGTTPSQVTVFINTSGLAFGSYSGNITVTAAGATNSPLNIPVTLQYLTQELSANFSSGAGGWVISPLGGATTWTASNGAYTHNGTAESLSCTGSSQWTDYQFSTQIKLASLSNYPGGIRGRVNSSTGAGYGVWLYPGSGLIRLYRIGQWKIDSGFSQLAQAALSYDTNVHSVQMTFQGSNITVLWDGNQVMQVNDSTYTNGLVCLDGSSQPVTYDNVSVVGTSSPPVLSSTPASLTVTTVPGGAATTQTSNLSSFGGSVAFTVASDSAWLTASTSAMVTPGAIGVTVTPGSLPAGTYSGNVIVTALGASNSPFSIPVTLTLSSGSIALSPTAMNFVGAIGADPAPQSISITSSGLTSPSFSAFSDSAWINISPTGGAIPGLIAVSPTASGQANGTYQGTVTLSSSGAGNSPLTTGVTFRVGTLLFQDNFSSSSNWILSPTGSASNWSVSGGVFAYNGAGTSQQYAGTRSWTDYTFSADFKLSSLSNYPGGIRARLNASTGAGYGVWLYPGNGVIKLFSIPQWNIDGSGTALLGQSGTVTFDTNWHNLRIDLKETSLFVYYDNVRVIQVTDPGLTAGTIGLEGSSQPIQFRNVRVIGY